MSFYCRKFFLKTDLKRMMNIFICTSICYVQPCVTFNPHLLQEKVLLRFAENSSGEGPVKFSRI